MRRERSKKGSSRVWERLRDGSQESQVVRKVHDTAETYRGPYRAEGPDLITGLLSWLPEFLE